MLNHSINFKRSAAPVLNNLVLNNQALGTVLAIWLGSSLALDVLVMPMLYRTGMMSTSSFASAGQAMFQTFNGLEIILAAIVLVAVWSRRQVRQLEAHLSLGGLGFPIVLLAIALVYRYVLTPHMGSMGIQLDWMSPAEMPPTMTLMHLSYWLLECLKLSICGILFNRCWRSAI